MRSAMKAPNAEKNIAWLSELRDFEIPTPMNPKDVMNQKNISRWKSWERWKKNCSLWYQLLRLA